MHPVLFQGLTRPLGMYTVMHGGVLLGAMVHILISTHTTPLLQHSTRGPCHFTTTTSDDSTTSCQPLAVTTWSCSWRSTVGIVSMWQGVWLSCSQCAGMACQHKCARVVLTCNHWMQHLLGLCSLSVSSAPQCPAAVCQVFVGEI